MRRFWKHGVAFVALAAAVGLWCLSSSLAKPPAGGATYQIVAFGPSQSVYGWVGGLNDQGQVVGDAAEVLPPAPGGRVQAVHLDIATGVYTPLQDGVNAHAVNNLNQSVGYSTSGKAAFWPNPSAAPVLLPALPVPPELPQGLAQTKALGVNDAGIVVGWSWDGVSVTAGANQEMVAQGVVWRVVVNGNSVTVQGPVELPPLVAGVPTYCTDVNALAGGAAKIVGESGDQAVVWTITLNQDGSLGTPTGPTLVSTLGGTWSTPGGINDGGDVCGCSPTLPSPPYYRPFVTLAGQQAAPLPVPRSTLWGRAYDINNAQQIVGAVCVSVKNLPGPGQRCAYFWKDGVAVDLNKQIPPLSGWQLREAHKINKSGVIGGTGQFDVNDRGFLLFPNP